jgi:hypothetical protein
MPFPVARDVTRFFHVETPSSMVDPAVPSRQRIRRDSVILSYQPDWHDKKVRSANFFKTWLLLKY